MKGDIIIDVDKKPNGLGDLITSFEDQENKTVRSFRDYEDIDFDFISHKYLLYQRSYKLVRGENMITSLPNYNVESLTIYYSTNDSIPLIIILEPIKETYHYYINLGDKWIREYIKNNLLTEDEIRYRINELSGKLLIINIGKYSGNYLTTTNAIINKTIILTENIIGIGNFKRYKHKSTRDLFILLNVINGNRQLLGINNVPLKNVYNLSVYYTSDPNNVPLFISIKTLTPNGNKYYYYRHVLDDNWTQVLTNYKKITSSTLIDTLNDLSGYKDVIDHYFNRSVLSSIDFNTSTKSFIITISIVGIFCILISALGLYYYIKTC